jgi:Protein of unknown function (DUF3102)
MKMRPLATIKRDLDLALKRESEHAILIGKLLTEANDQVKYGEWYQWLDKNFAMSKPSASRYMRLYEKTKSLNFSDLKIRTELLYAMYVDESFDEPVVKQILREAKRKWIGMKRAELLQRQHRSKDPVPPDWLIDWAEFRRLISEGVERGERVQKANLSPEDRHDLVPQLPEIEDWLDRLSDVVRSLRVVQFAEAAE